MALQQSITISPALNTRAFREMATQNPKVISSFADDYNACSVNESVMVLDFDINLRSFMSSHLSTTCGCWQIHAASSLVSIKGKHMTASNIKHTCFTS